MRIENFLKAQVSSKREKCELTCIFNAIRSGANAVSEFMRYFYATYGYFELTLELKIN